ncbi:MAG: rRNA maturation RNase YbeY [Dehalococcoidia bacterium]|nr:rRNA maturation RNase YbeY [Dehalococcoidia bacterium]
MPLHPLGRPAIPVTVQPQRTPVAPPVVAVSVLPPYHRKASAPLMRRAAQAAIAVGSRGQGPARVSVAVTDDETIRSLNAQYRGLDEVTDVLSFGWQEAAHGFPPTPKRQDSLGEVIIAYPRAARQAEERGHTARNELALLVVHGVLHLQGYDHEKADEQARMRTLEAKALRQMGIHRTLLGGGDRGR